MTMPSQANLAKIHIAIKELALPDETYRDILRQRFHVDTAAHLNDRQCFVLLSEFKRRGWKPRHGNTRAAAPKQSRALSQDAMARKIRALWLTLHEMGIVRDPGESALGAYTKRMTGVDALQWLDGKQMWTVLESLKKWVKRAERPGK